MRPLSTSGDDQVPGLMIKELPTDSADEGEKLHHSCSRMHIRADLSVADDLDICLHIA